MIVAVRNGAATLNRCLDSIREQSHSDIELIIMDAGSVDGTLDILKANSDVISYWESKKDRGIYHAWNKALQYVTGEWICFLGSDDCWAYSGAITDMITNGAKSNINLISGKLAYIDDKGDIGSEFGKAWSWDAIKKSHCIAHPGALFHRSCFDICGHFDESFRIAGDYDFSLSLGRFVNGYFLDRVLVHMGDSGLSRSQITTVLKESWRAKAGHPEIGKLKATFDLCRTFLIVFVKKLCNKF